MPLWIIIIRGIFEELKKGKFFTRIYPSGVKISPIIIEIGAWLFQNVP